MPACVSCLIRSLPGGRLMVGHTAESWVVQETCHWGSVPTHRTAHMMAVQHRLRYRWYGIDWCDTVWHV